jgi:hypothetical protein
MIAWEWTKQQVAPDDILDGARVIPGRGGETGVHLVDGWTSALTYLEWAKLAIERGGNDGWDSAAGWAKRAVCRQMDYILVHNHLQPFLGKSYKDKAGYLAALKVPGLPVLRDLVIDPRNDIEHVYALATKEQAETACHIAELFLGATEKEAKVPAILDLGWDFEWAGSITAGPEDVKHSVKVMLNKDHPPFITVVGYPDAPEAMILYPQDELVSVCPLRDFRSDQLLAFNDKLREQVRSESYSLRTVGLGFIRSICRELRL